MASSCVPDVVQFDRGSEGRQLVPDVRRWSDRRPMGDAFASLSRRARLSPRLRGLPHWWALAHYCLKALKETPPAAARAPRHQGRQRLRPGRPRASIRKSTTRRSIRCSASSRSSTSPFRWFRGEPRPRVADRLATEYDYQSPAAPAGTDRRPRRRSHRTTRAVRLAVRHSTVSRRCSSAICRTYVTARSPDRRIGWTTSATTRRRR